MYKLRLENAECNTAAKIASKERYRVNLPLHMAECEANYHRLVRLLAQQKIDQVGETFEFAWSGSEQHWVQSVQVIERSPYTTTLALTQRHFQSPSPWLQMPRLTVRMYHDAQVAEVLTWEGHKRLRPRYIYPNTAMYLADEKFQINLFLGEWLTRSLTDGIAYSKLGFSVFD